MKNIYKEIELDTEIMQASPHRLVQLMFEKIVDGILISKHLLQENDIPKKCQTITKVIDIVVYLRQTLDTEKPECRDISTHLSNVYSYVEHQLVLANLKNDPVYLDNALQHIQKIKDAWDKIGETAHDEA